MSEYLSLDWVRFVGLTVGAAGLSAWVRYFVAYTRGDGHARREFSIWIDVVVASVFNQVVLASEVARRPELSPLMGRQNESPDQILNLLGLTSITVIVMWIVSMISGRAAARAAREGLPWWTRLSWTFWASLFPNAFAFASLWSTYALGSAII